MRKLTRGITPGCLQNFQHGRDDWKCVTQTQKAEIWTKLFEMQGHRCAYCECDIENSPRHIEHFVQKGRVPAETFSWDNLFGSCCLKGTCGDRKDRVGTYNHADVLKPDIHDPDDFLLFVSDGTIKPRAGLNGDDRKVADMTLAVMGLHHENGPLRDMRRLAVAGYLQTVEGLAEFADVDPDNACGWREELDNELAVVAGLPFSTTIRHMFQSFMDF